MYCQTTQNHWLLQKLPDEIKKEYSFQKENQLESKSMSYRYMDIVHRLEVLYWFLNTSSLSLNRSLHCGTKMRLGLNRVLSFTSAIYSPGTQPWVVTTPSPLSARRQHSPPEQYWSNHKLTINSYFTQGNWNHKLNIIIERVFFFVVVFF